MNSTTHSRIRVVDPTHNKSKKRGRPVPTSSLYPLHPSDSHVVMHIPQSALTMLDRVAVAASSLFIVGSVVWVPLFYRWVYKKLQSLSDEETNEDPDGNITKRNKKRRKLYSVLVLCGTLLAIAGPHRSPRFGKWLRVRHWKLWESWLRFIAMEVILDQPKSNQNSNPSSATKPASSNTLQPDQNQQAVLAFVPHGLFPFAFAFGVFPAAAQQIFGFFHPVVATATQFFPVVRDVLHWCESIDASRSNVDGSLRDGQRIGIVPGGIAEMFEGYPKPNTTPDEEFAIVRKGFLKLALRHQVPVIPIYCFGSTKMFHRLHIPWLDDWSRKLRISLCILYGVCGLPIPFRQRLSYVVGDPIVPPPASTSASDVSQEQQQVDELHQTFCNELVRLFDRHKEAYGWGHKTLRLLTN